MIPCIKTVPVFFAAGKLCIEVAPNSKMAWISEELCIGCGICVKVLQPVTSLLVHDDNVS